MCVSVCEGVVVVGGWVGVGVRVCECMCECVSVCVCVCVVSEYRCWWSSE